MSRLKNNSPRKFWNLTPSLDGMSATLTIEGEICDTPNDWLSQSEKGHYYTSDDFRADLDSVRDARELTVLINSPGGNLYTGLAIHAALKAHPAKVTTVVQGIAMSAASVIFCAGDTRLVQPSSLLMLHGVAVGEDILGLYNEAGITDLLSKLRTDRAAVKKMNEAIATVYAAASGKSQADCLAMISGDTETWMTADDALASGFATAYSESGSAEPLTLVACGTKTALYAGTHLLSPDFRPPVNAAELGFIRKTPTNNKMETDEPQAPEAVDVTEPVAQAPEAPAPQETPAPAPVDTAAIAAAARIAERERIAGINALARKLGSRVDKTLVDQACFGGENHEPMTPEEFAVAAVNALPEDKPAYASPVNSDYLNARAEELAPADAVQTATPPATPAPKVNRGVAALNRILAREGKSTLNQ